MSKRKFTVEVDSLFSDASVVRVMNEALAPLRRVCGLRAIVVEGSGSAVYKCGEAYSYGGVTSVCTLPLGHEGDEHERRGTWGELVASWSGTSSTKILPAADRDDALEACVFQLDDVCKWLATRGYAVAADLLHENRNEFLLAPRLHAEPVQGSDFLALATDFLVDLQRRGRSVSSSDIGPLASLLRRVSDGSTRPRPETASPDARLGTVDCPHAEMCNGCTSAADVTAIYTEVRAETIEECVRHVEAHSCVASCCDAQPSAGEAKSLADCVRRAVHEKGKDRDA